MRDETDDFFCQIYTCSCCNAIASDDGIIIDSAYCNLSKSDAKKFAMQILEMCDEEE